MKIALALIVKGSKEEAVFLERCLHDISPYVDGVFVTSTSKEGETKNAEVDSVGKKYGAYMSYFRWVNDFAAARNFNFSQVTKDYDFILWCDADDTIFRIEKLREYLEQSPETDAWTMQYYYERDSSNNPTVVHTKTQIVRNDGCVNWTGRIHEDFKENRSLTVRYISELKRIHLTTDEHVEQARLRNLEISKLDVLDRGNDPRVYFNLGNSYMGLGRNEPARKEFKKFLSMSNSDDEKYVIYQRLAHVEVSLGNKAKAIEYLTMAIGLYPEYPDARNQMGYMQFDFGNMDAAERYLFNALLVKPQYQRMVVYNPRDYDYNPMMALAKVYFKKSRPDLALPMLKGCLGIYSDDPKLKGLVEEMEVETKRLDKVVEAAKHIDTLNGDKKKVLYTINKLPKDLQSHPLICKIRNEYEIKTTSTGKDIAYYCGESVSEWNPELFKTVGVGGSEEAVVNLAKEWSKAGYNVTVYNSCGIQPMVADGVTYKPWWMFNGKDVWDHLIMWRHPKLCDYELGAKNVYIDLHDVVSEGEFTEKRLKRIKKIFVKTKAHRVLFPNIPDEKFAIIQNGYDKDLFSKISKIKRDPYLLVNTSSPDRSMDVLPALFKEVKKRVPKARLVWCYGWNNFDKWHASDKRMMAWRDKISAEMKESGIESLGRLSQQECADWYMKGRILAYPSDFYEISCISVIKAQAAGCKPITTDFAAMKESNISGIKVHTDRTTENWSLPYQVGFGTKYEKAQKEWVDAVVAELKKPMVNGIYNMSKFSWGSISSEWLTEFK